MMDRRIVAAIGRMEQSLDDCVRTAELARTVNLSRSRFAQLFRAETGMSPHRYLHALRMQRARDLVERTFLSVKEVMVCVGVNDPSHFARDFKRFHGIPPSRLRRAGWAADGRVLAVPATPPFDAND